MPELSIGSKGWFHYGLDEHFHQEGRVRREIFYGRDTAKAASALILTLNVEAEFCRCGSSSDGDHDVFGLAGNSSTDGKEEAEEWFGLGASPLNVWHPQRFAPMKVKICASLIKPNLLPARPSFS